ncbi:MAG: sel1 repeat family protein [Burkholderiaceae bacterium]|nr:sel1 repeat family protein [Burkholderiaceae bacterium]
MPMLLEDGKIALKAYRYAAAYEIFMDLAKNEDQHAIMYLGDMLMNGQVIGDQLIELQAFLGKEAKRGWGAVFFNLGAMYERGLTVEKDLNMAIFYYNQACDQLVPQAHVNLAYIYTNQEPLNVPKALKHLQEAIDLGSTNACNTLGLMYMNGKNVEKDLTKAFGYLMAAAREKNEEAKKNIYLLQTLYPMNDFEEGKDLASEIIIKMANSRDRYGPT